MTRELGCTGPRVMGGVTLLLIISCGGCGDGSGQGGQNYPVYWNEKVYKGEGLYCIGVGYTSSGSGVVQTVTHDGPKTVRFLVYNGIRDDVFLLAGRDRLGHDPYVEWRETHLGAEPGLANRSVGWPGWDVDDAQECVYLPRCTATVGDRIPSDKSETYLVEFRLPFYDRQAGQRSEFSFQRPVLYYIRGRPDLNANTIRRTILFTFAGPGKKVAE